MRAVEDTDIVEPEKPAFIEVVARAVLAVYPPAKIRAQLAKDSLQKIEVGPALQRLLGAVQKNRRKGLHRRVDVAEIPFIGRDLTGRMEIDLLEQHVELMFGEIDVDH